MHFLVSNLLQNIYFLLETKFYSAIKRSSMNGFLFPGSPTATKLVKWNVSNGSSVSEHVCVFRNIIQSVVV